MTATVRKTESLPEQKISAEPAVSETQWGLSAKPDVFALSFFQLKMNLFARLGRIKIPLLKIYT